jgi:hypothetical protein
MPVCSARGSSTGTRRAGRPRPRAGQPPRTGPPAITGWARARRDLGHSALAREHASRAVDIYLSLGLSEAAEARDLLASLG